MTHVVAVKFYNVSILKVFYSVITLQYSYAFIQNFIAIFDLYGHKERKQINAA